jgi:ABC-type transport system involved in Fe-S cluster assembly fused permease/ATPase subunit
MDNKDLNNSSENTKIEYIIIYNTYTPKSKANMYKYREEHKKEYRDYQNNYYKEKYNNNPEFKEKEKEKARNRYQKKVLEKKSDLEFLNSFFFNN